MSQQVADEMNQHLMTDNLYNQPHLVDEQCTTYSATTDNTDSTEKQFHYKITETELSLHELKS